MSRASASYAVFQEQGQNVSFRAKRDQYLSVWPWVVAHSTSIVATVDHPLIRGSGQACRSIPVRRGAAFV